MASTQSIRILYMEDDPDQAHLFQTRLQAAGYHVDIASDGEAGIAMQQAGSYDVLVIDQHMPGYNGFEVLEFLTSQDPMPPVIMLTSFGSEKLAVAAMKLGASDYIVKDDDNGYLSLLPSVIEQALHRQRLVEEKYQAEIARARLNTIVEATTDFVSVSNVKGKVLYINKAGRKMLGLGKKEVLEMYISDCFAHWARNLVSFEGVNAAVENGSWNGEAALLNRNGQEIPVSQVILAQKSKRGDVEFISIIARDISDNKLVEETLLRVQDELEQRVKERTAELSEANEILREEIAERERIEQEQQRLIEELDAFAETVAHDIKSPLSLITGFANFLASEYETLPADEIQAYLESLTLNSYKASEIVDELLLLASVRQTESVEIGHLDMASIVAEAQNRFAHIIDEYQAKIILPDTWPAALGYSPWLEEVWANYLSNAIKYGGTPPLIKLGAKVQPDGMVRFWVKDNGQGLTPEEQSQLFVPFTKLDHSTVDGHGLGLSIVQRIIRNLDGQVSVESRGVPGLGSIFSFTLPGVPDKP